MHDQHQLKPFGNSLQQLACLCTREAMQGSLSRPKISEAALLYIQGSPHAHT